MVEEESQYGNGSSLFSHPYWVTIRKSSGRKPIDGELCLLYRLMARNLKRYYQAWELRQQGLIFKDIGKIMGITGSRANVLCNFIDFKIKYQKQRRISNELKDLVKKYF
ncbi:MAG: hypothetical protein UR63_C0043G0020 [Candidatus Roizmanbacteria bacterium GW2011_GWC2_35_12]|uniref:Uncharacterized protein n=2 Tax=Candidatus Roizmaniibacteriota TaxID=1752723 RepID=A0A0F9YZ75_9BACT|nr:MAG: hypothetical protein UR23_C0013G0004 [Candidatus Roizmanbacteria bacterium GW2011_GWA2_32_13]KKP65825.1 MAG: hypothetical protein UR63_C0043G0020 [Candidatus Roizmanbacteria bacterium GW2011_GWC2_35_12]